MRRTIKIGFALVLLGINVSCTTTSNSPGPKGAGTPTSPSPSQQNPGFIRVPGAGGILNDTNVRPRILSSEKLFRRIRPLVPADHNPEVSGLLTDSPRLVLYVTYKQWRKLTKAEQVDLTWYLESLVQKAKSQPEKYVSVSRTAPAYQYCPQKTRDSCRDCWQIALGDPVIEEGEPAMTVDRVAVLGDSAWEKDRTEADPVCLGSDDRCGPGEKASEFRK